RRGRHSPGPMSSERRFGQMDRKRSASPLARTKAFRNEKHPGSSGFSSGAHGQRSTAVCAVCLGRHHHNFIECSAERLWDNSHAAVSKRVSRQLLIRSTDKSLCVDWQRGKGCGTRSHDERHLCS
ncbi:hypothetical protein DEU56DRAFT_690983, partial [Suillus clintonianus]|uniref:uncharacterized protein n=1 Tax=Suillus clintonianus TaxID=1904413 RepID=UPI001B88042E